MPIIQVTTEFAGQSGVLPRLVRLLSSDDYDTVTAEGYLNSLSGMGIQLLPSDFIFASYSDGFGMFNPSFAASNITLVPTISTGNIDGPLVVHGNVQAGESGESGYFISYPATATTGYLAFQAVANSGDYIITVSNKSMGQATTISIPDPGASTADFILSKKTGTQHITVGSLQVDAGTLISGLSTGGQVGTLQLFPTTTTTGSVRWLAAANGGAFNVDFTNASHGQSTVYTFADIGASTGGIPVATTAIKMKAVAGAAAAGGAAAQSFTDAFCTSGSNVIGNWNTQANAASVLKIVPGNGSFVVTSSADAGVGTFNYIITK